MVKGGERNYNGDYLERVWFKGHPELLYIYIYILNLIKKPWAFIRVCQGSIRVPLKGTIRVLKVFFFGGGVDVGT